MNRSEITKRLSELTEKYINPNRDPRIYWAKEVTFDYGTEHQIRVDYMKFKPMNNTVSGIEKGDFYCFEIKSCVDDFNSNNGHNFLGDYNYYVMTQGTYEKVKDKIPYSVGVLVPDDSWDILDIFKTLKCVKRVHRQDRARPVNEMLLMMFRSANRDRRINNDT